MAGFEEEGCCRHQVTINGENFYFSIGTGFIDATVPHENRPDGWQLRRTVDAICAGIAHKEWGDDRKLAHIVTALTAALPGPQVGE